MSKKEGLYPRQLERIALEWISANPLIFGQYDPVLCAGVREPLGIGRVLREMIVMHFDAHAGIAQGLRDNSFAEAAIYEEDE